MKYIKEDLDFIFIRTKNSSGKWDNLSLNQVTDKQFVDWAKNRFNIEIKDDVSVRENPWTPEQKIHFLNSMSKRMGGKDCVVMVKRNVRKKWK